MKAATAAINRDVKQTELEWKARALSFCVTYNPGMLKHLAEEKQPKITADMSFGG